VILIPTVPRPLFSRNEVSEATYIVTSGDVTKDGISKEFVDARPSAYRALGRGKASALIGCCNSARPL
jgi:hypothetical protein